MKNKLPLKEMLDIICNDDIEKVIKIAQGGITTRNLRYVKSGSVQARNLIKVIKLSAKLDNCRKLLNKYAESIPAISPALLKKYRRGVK